MDWEPIAEEALWDLITAAWKRMTLPQRHFWEVVRVEPVKWEQHPWGDEGGGFWTVAILGSVVLWYNDIEDGFNRSNYSRFGEINEYRCNQDELEWAVQGLMNLMEIGYDPGRHAGPPPPIQ